MGTWVFVWKIKLIQAQNLKKHICNDPNQTCFQMFALQKFSKFGLFGPIRQGNFFPKSYVFHPTLSSSASYSHSPPCAGEAQIWWGSDLASDQPMYGTVQRYLDRGFQFGLLGLGPALCRSADVGRSMNICSLCRRKGFIQLPECFSNETKKGEIPAYSSTGDHRARKDLVGCPALPYNTVDCPTRCCIWLCISLVLHCGVVYPYTHPPLLATPSLPSGV